MPFIFSGRGLIRTDCVWYDVCHLFFVPGVVGRLSEVGTGGLALGVLIKKKSVNQQQRKVVGTLEIFILSSYRLSTVGIILIL